MKFCKTRDLFYRLPFLSGSLTLLFLILFLSPDPAVAKSANADCSTPYVRNMTFEQSMKRHANTLKCRIENGQDINGIIETGGTALEFAVFNNNVEFIRFLLAKGADVNISKGKVMFTAVGNMFYLGLAETELQRKLTKQQKIKHLLERFDARFSTLELLLESGGSLKAVDQKSSRYPVSLLHTFVIRLCKERFSSLDYTNYFNRISAASNHRAKLLSFDLELMKVWMRVELEGDEKFDRKCLSDAVNRF